MRIIAGEFRGRTLLPPPSQVTRPVTDRVKQSVFDILTPVIADANVYDCFAGTGSMGLECLSRGASCVTFFETDRGAVERLRRNIQTLGADARSTVVSTNLFRWFADPKSRGGASLVFLDPPYRFVREKPEALRSLAADLAARHLAGGATVVFRHDAADRLDLPPLIRADVREYGSMTVEFLRLEDLGSGAQNASP
jgi:16S rRNA (guanine966-N2)-methyltransferase